MAITLILLWLCQIVFFERIYKTIMIRDIKRDADTIIATETSDNFMARTEALCESSNSCITLYSHTDKASIDVSSTKYKECYLYDLKINDIMDLYDKAYENGGELLYTFSPDPERNSFVGVPFSEESSDENHSVLLVKIFTSKANKDCAVFINRVISPVGATTTTMLHILIMLSGIYVIMAILMVIISSKNLARPLVEVNKAANELGKGNYFARYMPKRGYREVDELAHTLENASQELSKVDMLQRELIANVSHDLRTPLTLISGYSEIMRDIPGEATKENCQVIIDEVGKLSSLVNDLLEISKLQSGNMQIERSEFSLVSLLGECIHGYDELAAAQGYTLLLECDRDVTLSADRTMIFQALRNLINNALTYTGDDKTVRVSITFAEHFVRISVTDSGEGIAPEHLRDIWDRYYRDPEHKRAKSGTGLGLSIVKSVVKLHSGRYGVRSKLGSGSTFWIELPVGTIEN